MIAQVTALAAAGMRFALRYLSLEAPSLTDLTQNRVHFECGPGAHAHTARPQSGTAACPLRQANFIAPLRSPATGALSARYPTWRAAATSKRAHSRGPKSRPARPCPAHTIVLVVNI